MAPKSPPGALAIATVAERAASGLAPPRRPAALQPETRQQALEGSSRGDDVTRAVHWGKGKGDYVPPAVAFEPSSQSGGVLPEGTFPTLQGLVGGSFRRGTADSESGSSITVSLADLSGPLPPTSTSFTRGTVKGGARSAALVQPAVIPFPFRMTVPAMGSVSPVRQAAVQAAEAFWMLPQPDRSGNSRALSPVAAVRRIVSGSASARGDGGSSSAARRKPDIPPKHIPSSTSRRKPDIPPKHRSGASGGPSWPDVPSSTSGSSSFDEDRGVNNPAGAGLMPEAAAVSTSGRRSAQAAAAPKPRRTAAAAQKPPPPRPTAAGSLNYRAPTVASTLRSCWDGGSLEAAELLVAGVDDGLWCERQKDEGSPF